MWVFSHKIFWYHGPKGQNLPIKFEKNHATHPRSNGDEHSLLNLLKIRRPKASHSLQLIQLCLRSMELQRERRVGRTFSNELLDVVNMN